MNKEKYKKRKEDPTDKYWRYHDLKKDEQGSSNKQKSVKEVKN